MYVPRSKADKCIEIYENNENLTFHACTSLESR